MYRALKAYFRRFGESADQPNMQISHEDYDEDDGCIVFVTLANVRGTLARYRVIDDGPLFYRRRA